MVVLGTLAAGLTAIALATFLWLRAFMVDRVDAQLANTATLAQGYITTSSQAGQPSATFGGGGDNATWNAVAKAGLLPSYLEIRGPDDTVLARLLPAGNAPQLPARLATRVSGNQGAAALLNVASHQAGEPTHYRVRVSRLPGSADVLVLAMPIDDVYDTLRAVGVLEVTLWSVTFVMVGWIATRRIRTALRPLDRIGDEASAIDAGDLDRRVAPADPDTEVGRLAIALNTMLGRLQASFAERQASEERLRRFVADASHELRTPLTSIRGYAELFRRGAADRPEDLALAMSRIESEATRMGVLVDELLLLARLDSGRPLGREPVDLTAIAHDAAADFRAAAPDRPIDVEAPEPTVILGDHDRLLQILANLLANVRQHTPPATPARLSVRMTDGTAIVEVTDSGPGLTAEQCARVFERFYRGDESRTRSADRNGRAGTASFGGAGLGLSIVAAVAVAHGGRAEVCPASGGGTVFRVLIPASEAEPDAGPDSQRAHS
jgi:two-component system, OmpR family, sensor kinase